MRTLYRIANLTTDSVTFEINDYEADSRKGLRKLREQHSNSYSEKQKVSRTELEDMKNKIASIERL